MSSLVVAPDTKMAVRVELLHRAAKTTLKPPRTLTKEEWPPNYEEVLVWRKAQLARYETDPDFLANAKKYYASGWQGCVAFINHWCDTHDPRNSNTDKLVWMPFILFEKQERLVEFVMSCLKDDQPGLVEKSRTMGATWVCVAISVWMWLFHPGTAVGWGSQDAVSVDQIGDPKSIFFKIRGLIERLPYVFKPPHLSDSDIKQKVCYNPLNGSSIVGEVGDKIGRGGRTRVFFKDESSHYEHPEVIEASLAATTRVPIDISSVNGLGNLFHRKREGGMDWFPGAKIPRGKTRVFVMDWSDSPQYDQQWFEETKQFHLDQATYHVFASEFERNYAAAIQGVIIPMEWLDSCINAHIKLGLPKGGPKMSALDIGDAEDGDRNAQSVREGVTLTQADEWTARDPGVTARRAMGTCVEQGVPELQYDAAGGLGSIVKSEVNRLQDEKAMPKNLRVIPWNAGGKVLHPAERVVPRDERSPRNKDFFTNLKAQGWWHLRTIVYNTHMAVTRGGRYSEEAGKVVIQNAPVVDADHVAVLPSMYDIDELFAIDSKIPLLQKVKKELCQATASKGSKLKLLVDKAPEGTRSPNIADSIVMNYWPMPANIGEFTNIGMGPAIFLGGVTVR